jgi:hypothetical protein
MRQALPQEHLPNDGQLVVIIRMVRAKLKVKIQEACARSPFVNIALDGWTDPGRRKYQGVVIRTVQLSGITHVFLAIQKPVLPRNETPAVLGASVGHGIRRYHLENKPLSLCTDGGINTVKAFRSAPGRRGSFR